MNVSELKEVTNKKIIKQAELSNPYELKWQDSV
jgi:hypothetical protein